MNASARTMETENLHVSRRTDTSKSELFDNRRKAHRVFRNDNSADRFNPFRHLPWDVKPLTDIESDRRHGETGEVSSLFGFKYTWKPLKPKPPPEQPFTLGNQIRRTLLTSWINILLPCVPIGIILAQVRGSAPETFAINYAAEIPLWFMCDYAMEEIEKYIGIGATDLLDIFTTNTVQIISSILLLKAGQVALLQTSLVGGILSNILALLGVSIWIGGMRNNDKREQRFNRLGAHGSSSLLSIAATSLIIPTAVNLLGQTTPEKLVLQSRGVAVVLLFVYLSYTLCQLWTHKDEYRHSGKDAKTSAGNQSNVPVVEPRRPSETRIGPDSLELNNLPSPSSVGPVSTPPDPDHPEGGVGNLNPSNDEITGPQLDLPVALIVFAATIVLLYFCIDATVNSISTLTGQKISQTFVGLILLPIPNCDFAPISLAVDDQLEQTMKYTVGRSIQTALLVEPLVVLLAWFMHIPNVTLAFDGFEVVSLFTTILLLNFLVIDAKVHWVHGILLIADWVLIGIAAYFVN